VTAHGPDPGDRRDQELDARLRAWGRRPARTPAASAAGTIVARATTETRRGTLPVFRFAAGVAALAAVLVASWWGIGPRPERAPAADLPPVLPENVVQFWLDPETPVYFVTGPARPGEGDLP
jgi:hypothetical protein